MGYLSPLDAECRLGPFWSDDQICQSKGIQKTHTSDKIKHTYYLTISRRTLSSDLSGFLESTTSPPPPTIRKLLSVEWGNRHDHGLVCDQDNPYTRDDRPIEPVFDSAMGTTLLLAQRQRQRRYHNVGMGTSQSGRHGRQVGSTVFPESLDIYERYFRRKGEDESEPCDAHAVSAVLDFFSFTRAIRCLDR